MQRGRGGGRQNTGHTEGDQGAVEADDKTIIGMDAVSYTHLDVYKRQAQNRIQHHCGQDSYEAAGEILPIVHPERAEKQAQDVV